MGWVPKKFLVAGMWLQFSTFPCLQTAVRVTSAARMLSYFVVSCLWESSLNRNSFTFNVFPLVSSICFLAFLTLIFYFLHFPSSDSSLLGTPSLTPAKQMKLMVRSVENSAILSVLDSPTIHRKRPTNPALQGILNFHSPSRLGIDVDVFFRQQLSLSRTIIL